jgi:hypothetical protein
MNELLNEKEALEREISNTPNRVGGYGSTFDYPDAPASEPTQESRLLDAIDAMKDPAGDPNEMNDLLNQREALELEISNTPNRVGGKGSTFSYPDAPADEPPVSLLDEKVAAKIRQEDLAKIETQIENERIAKEMVDETTSAKVADFENTMEEQGENRVEKNAFNDNLLKEATARIAKIDSQTGTKEQVASMKKIMNASTVKAT